MARASRRNRTSWSSRSGISCRRRTRSPGCSLRRPGRRWRSRAWRSAAPTNSPPRSGSWCPRRGRSTRGPNRSRTKPMPEWSAADREAYLALALVPGIGAARVGALLDRLETPARVLAAGSEALGAVQGISTAAATAIAGADLRQARAAMARLAEPGGQLLLTGDAAVPAGPRRRPGRGAMARLAERGGQLLLPGDAAFPAALRDIPDPPLHLFALGDVALLSRPAVAIVGSRDHSLYGAEVCRAVARAAAEAGLAVVSGMARGLDAVAHAGALEGKGATIGVLGDGLGVGYPAANRAL